MTKSTFGWGILGAGRIAKHRPAYGRYLLDVAAEPNIEIDPFESHPLEQLVEPRRLFWRAWRAGLSVQTGREPCGNSLAGSFPEIGLPGG